MDSLFGKTDWTNYLNPYLKIHFKDSSIQPVYEIQHLKSTKKGNIYHSPKYETNIVYTLL